MARRTAQEAQRTRQRILDAALRVFCSQGVGASSFEEIAEAAGVTRGAIYWHFRDKSDLLAQALDSRLLPLESLQAGPSIAEDRDRVVRALLRTVRHSPSRRMVQILLQKADRPCTAVVLARTHAARQRFHAYLVAVLLRAQQTPSTPASLHEPDVAAWARTIQACVTGLLFELLLTPRRQQRERLQDSVQVLLRASRGPCAPGLKHAHLHYTGAVGAAGTPAVRGKC